MTVMERVGLFFKIFLGVPLAGALLYGFIRLANWASLKTLDFLYQHFTDIQIGILVIIFVWALVCLAIAAIQDDTENKDEPSGL
jgi:hypothetical protein